MPTQVPVPTFFSPVPPPFRSSQLLKTVPCRRSTACTSPTAHPYLQRSPESCTPVTGVLPHAQPQLHYSNWLAPMLSCRRSSRTPSNGTPSSSSHLVGPVSQPTKRSQSSPSLTYASCEPSHQLATHHSFRPKPMCTHLHAPDRTAQIRWMTTPASRDALPAPLELLQDHSTPLNHVPARW